MSQMSSKLEQVLEFLVNGEQDKAQELLHDTIVEKAREIHEEIVNSQENDTVTEEESSEETTEEAVEEAADSEEEAVEETVGGTGDQEEDLKAELKQKAEEDAEEIDYEQTNEDDDEDDDDDAKEDEEHEEEVEDMKKEVNDIEQALEDLKAKFNELVGNKDEEPADEESDEEDNGDMGMEMPAEESVEPLEEAELKAVKVDHADGSDATKSPVAGAPKENANGAKPGVSTGGEEKGGQTPKAGNMGATTEPKLSQVKVDHKDGSDSSAKSPVASK